MDDEQERLPYALALSGGGFRATLFHAGALIRLNELALLPKVGAICGVSGGALNAGLLGARWSKLGFDGSGRAANLDSEIVAPLRRLCARNADLIPSFVNMAAMLIGAPSTALATEYDHRLFHGLTLSDMPTGGDGPAVIIIAVNLLTGAETYFTHAAIHERRLGRLLVPQLKLAQAVAASSGYPPFLSPVVIHADPQRWQATPEADLHGNAQVSRKLVLADGGIFDALGVEPLRGRCATLLVSDASVTRQLWNPGAFWPRQWSRVTLLTTANTAVARHQQLDEALRGSGRLADGTEVVLWGNGRRIDDYGVSDALCRDSEKTRAQAELRTRLNRFKPWEQPLLINWGYAQCDAATRQWARANGQPVPPAAWPVPEYAL